MAFNQQTSDFVFGRNYEEELKRRKALALSQGWSDDQANRSAAIESAYHSLQQQQQPQQQAQPQKKKVSGLKKFLVNTGALVADTALGIGGAALAPVSGGASLAGAFAGGAGVEALRRKMLGEDQSVGASLLEGGLTAIPLVGTATKAFRGARAAKEGVELVNDARKTTKAVDATRQTAQIVPPKQQLTSDVRDMFKPAGTDTNALSRKGNAVRGNTQGIYPGAKVGSDELGVSGSKDLNAMVDDVLRSRGFTAKLFPQSTAGKLGVIENERTKVGEQIGDMLAKNNRKLTTADYDSMGNSIRAKLAEVGDLDLNKKSNVELVNTLLKQVDKPDLLGVETGRRNIDKIAKSAFKESDSTTQYKARIAEAVRHGVDEFVTGTLPQSKAIKGQYGKLIEAEKYMRKAAAENVSFAGGLKGGAVPSASARGSIGRASQTVADATGLGLQNAGRIISTPAFKQAAAQYGLRALSGSDQVTGATASDQQRPDQFTDINQAAPVGPNGVGDTGGLPANFTLDDMFKAADAQDAMAQQPDSGIGYSSAELFNAATKAFQAGDSKASDQFLQLAAFAQDYETAAAKAAKESGGNGPNITKVTAQQYGLAQSGAGALQQLTQMIQQDPNIVTKTATPGRGLPILGGFISNAAGTGEYDALGYNIADSILRLRTGAQANESEVKKLQTQIMPRAGDSQATIQRKIQQIQAIFGGVLDTANSGAGSDDFSTMFSQFQTQGAY